MSDALAERPSAEAFLAATCCRWPPSRASAAAIRRATAGPIDWHRFMHVCRQHRIEALALAGLSHAEVTVPEAVRDHLSTRASATALENLQNAAEEVRIFRAFEDRGIEMVFIKGTTLALLAYGSLSVKAARDIDFLVARSDVERTCALLADLGYERCTPDATLSETEYRRWFDHSKEMVWLHPRLGALVELHFALVDNPRLLDKVGIGSPRRIVGESGRLTLPTFASEELFSYLCVHGTLHFWSRLKWLADLAAFIERNGLDPDRLYRASLALGGGRCAALALLLCNLFFDTSLPAGLIAELRSDRPVRLLERTALAAIAARETQEDDTESAWQLLRQLAALCLAKPGWRYALAELRMRLFFPYSAWHLKASPLLWPLLTLVLLPRFILKRARLRRSARPTSNVARG